MERNKTYHVSTVFTAVTGLTLEYSKVHDLVDLFHPGIMTMGMARMLKSVGERCAKQHPLLLQLDPSTLPDVSAASRDEGFAICRAWCEQEADRIGLPYNLTITASSSDDLTEEEIAAMFRAAR